MQAPIKCRKCNVEITAENTLKSFFDRGFTICRDCNRSDRKERYIRYRIEIIEKLGNACQCCGETNYHFLSIDHIYGNGHQESLKGNMRGSNYIIKLNNLPIEDLKAKYQCLCFNCNYTKGFYGVCAHKLENKKYELLIGNRGEKQTHLPPKEHKKRELALSNIASLKAKLEMLQAYGNECVNCSEKHPLFLVLDHINNNGYLEGKKSGREYNKFLHRLGYPGKGTELQILCHNCNAKKEYTDNRINKQETISCKPIQYIAQPYSLTDEQEEELKFKARYLYAQIQDKKN